jgi:hypothetical protein
MAVRFARGARGLGGLLLSGAVAAAALSEVSGLRDWSGAWRPSQGFTASRATRLNSLLASLRPITARRKPLRPGARSLQRSLLDAA